MSKVHHYTTKGRFSIGRDGLEQQVVLVTPYGTVSQLWPDGECEYDPEMDCGEVLSLIEERLKSYWIHTSRDRDLQKIAAIRERLNEVNAIWLQSMALRWQAEAAKASKKARMYADMANEAEAA